jgi:hypothetical protein
VSDKKEIVSIGSGFDRQIIGRAEREVLADGMVVIAISIDNPPFGEWSIAGFNPLRIRGYIPPVLERNSVTVPDEDQADEVEAREREAAEKMAEKLTEGK